jgi:tetratricopeptide (TPR) repeat protein
MRKLILKAVTTIVLAAPSCMLLLAQNPPDVRDRVQTLEQEARGYLQEQKPQLAIPIFRQIIALDPDNLNAHGNLGVLLFFQGDYANAIPQLRSALQSKADLWKLQALLGIAEKRTGNPAEAQQDLEQAFPNLDDKNIRKEAGLELIELDSSSGELMKALSITQALEKASPQDPQLLFVAYEISSQVLYQTLLNTMVIAPDSAEMHMMMAGELARRGDRARAIAQYHDALRLNPNMPGAHYELAEQLRTSPDPVQNAEAENEFKAALKINQYDEKSWRRLGEILAAKGDYQSAEEDYQKALALQPADSDAETDMAIAFISTNRTREAVPLLEKAEKDDPTNLAAHYRLSLLYRREGRTQDAQHETDQFVHYRGLKDKLGSLFKEMAEQNSPK